MNRISIGIQMPNVQLIVNTFNATEKYPNGGVYLQYEDQSAVQQINFNNDEAIELAIALLQLAHGRY